MAKKGSKGGRARSVVIRKEEISEEGHHGGAWKVAYADFVTAMMAFFLLMWLLNATTEQQRRGIADYFSPDATVISHSTSGSGAPFGGRTPFDDGPAVSDRGAIQVMSAKTQPVDAEDDGSDTPAQKVVHQQTGNAEGPAQGAADANDDGTDAAGGGNPASETETGGPGSADRDSAHGTISAANSTTPANDATAVSAAASGLAGASGGTNSGAAAAEIAAAAGQREAQSFARAAQEIGNVVRSEPQLAAIAHQLAVDMTPEGLRIQIIDADDQPMFATGSTEPNERARLILQKIAPVLMRLSEPISIAGYTDAAPYAGPDRSNWELSADRANATRRLLLQAGLPDSRIHSVTGHADRDPLLPREPLAAANRRIAILVERAAPAPSSDPPAAATASPLRPAATVTSSR